MDGITISEKNVFHIHRKIIAELGQANDCDISTATRIYAHQNGIPYDCDDMKEFEAYCAYIQSETNKGKNLVRRYFYGE